MSGFFLLCTFLYWYVVHAKEMLFLRGMESILFGEKLQMEKKEHCAIEGKTLSVLEENVEIPFPLIYFDLGIRKLYRVYRFIYAKESEKNFFGTYRFPVTTGIGAIHEDPDMVIDETSDLITIFYNKEPVDGFFIGKNLFSQKLLFVHKPNLSELKNKDGVCYY